MNQKYDVCIVTMNFVKNDARTFNLSNLLVEMGFSVAVIAPEDSSDYKYNFDVYKVKINSDSKLYKRLLLFNLAVIKQFKHINARFYLSSELYSLPATRFLQKKKLGILIYDSREIFSAIGNISNNKPKQLFFKYLEKYYIRFVDKIIVTGNLDSEYLKQYFDHDTPYYLIMNLPYFQPKVKSNLIREYFGISESKIIVLYQGMIMKGRGIEPAIEILSTTNDLVLCLIGNYCDYTEKLLQIARQNGVEDKLYFKDFVDYDMLHSWTCSADIGIALFEPISLSYKLALPNKLFEYAMAGLPVLATKLPAIQEVAEGYNYVKLIDYPFDTNLMIQSINELTNIETKEQIESNALKFSEKYNYASQIAVIKQIFELI